LQDKRTVIDHECRVRWSRDLRSKSHQNPMSLVM